MHLGRGGPGAGSRRPRCRGALSWSGWRRGRRSARPAARACSSSVDTTGDTAATPGQVVGGDGVEHVDHGPGVGGAARHLLRGLQPLENTNNGTCSVRLRKFMLLPLLRCCDQPANNATDEVTLPSQFCRRGTSKTNCKV